MYAYLMDMLECPVCHGTLRWDVTEETEDRIETGMATCLQCSAAYPICEGIGIFLTSHLPRTDSWEQVESQLMLYLREHPDLERDLVDVTTDTLGRTDLAYRAMVLEERKEFQRSKALDELAEKGIDTAEYRACWQSQVEYVLEQVAGIKGPIIDLASGRGDLVEEMAQRLDRPIVATDFSPHILRRDRKRLEARGLLR
jgi:uncharacterized protein YbaR (Trm112 family)